MTIEQFVAEVDAYIHWYNEKRIKISLGSLSPVEYRKILGLSIKTVQVFIRTPTGSVPRGNQQKAEDKPSQPLCYPKRILKPVVVTDASWKGPLHDCLLSRRTRYPNEKRG